MSPLTPTRTASTLLVFTLGDRRETARRRLLPARWRAEERRLHRACLDNALTAGREAGLRLEVSSPARHLDLPSDVTLRRQQGRGFGSRLRSSLAESFRVSDGPVLLVGSDAPGLDAEHLRASLGALHQDPDAVVVGPSTDGGFYLLASNQPLDDVLSDLRWCCRSTCEQLLRALERHGRRVVMLPALRDLDHRNDLEQWLALERRESSWSPLLRDLIPLLALLRLVIDQPTAPKPRRTAFSATLLRGPPRGFVAAL